MHLFVYKKSSFSLVHLLKWTRDSSGWSWEHKTKEIWLQLKDRGACMWNFLVPYFERVKKSENFEVSILSLKIPERKIKYVDEERGRYIHTLYNQMITVRVFFSISYRYWNIILKKQYIKLHVESWRILSHISELASPINNAHGNN